MWEMASSLECAGPDRTWFCFCCMTHLAHFSLIPALSDPVFIFKFDVFVLSDFFTLILIFKNISLKYYFISPTTTCTSMFTAALCTLAPKWKQSKCPSTDERICLNVVSPCHRLFSNEREWSSETCYNMNEPCEVNEASHKAHCMSPFIHRDKVDEGCRRLGDSGECGEWPPMVSFWGDNVWNLVVEMVAQLWIY